MSNSAYQIQSRTLSAAEWSQVVEQFEDANIYQTWSYGSIRWGSKNLSHLVMHHNGRLVAAAQLRIVKPTILKNGIAYLRWGPMCQRRGHEAEPEVFRQMAKALYDEYVVRQRLFLRILPNAFDRTPRAQFFQNTFPKFNYTSPRSASVTQTFRLDLEPSLDDLRKRLDQKWRNQLNRAEKNGLSIIEGHGANEYREFKAIYDEMWSRKKFKTTVDVDEFGRIAADLPEGPLKLKILVCQFNGIPVSSIVCSAIGDTGIYLLGATNDAGLKVKGAYLLQWTMIRWLKENGFRYYDLGGIDPELNPGVYHFKQGLSGQDVSHIYPLDACTSWLSSLLMKGAGWVQFGLRNRIPGSAKQMAHDQPSPAPETAAVTR